MLPIPFLTLYCKQWLSVSVVLSGNRTSSVLSCDGRTIKAELKPMGRVMFYLLGDFCFRLSQSWRAQSVLCKMDHV